MSRLFALAANVLLTVIILLFLLFADRLAAKYLLEPSSDIHKAIRLSCDPNVYFLERGDVAGHVLSKAKAPNTFRIFTFGGSSTWGLPYGTAGSFSYFLKRLVQDLNPDKTVEVVNLGYPSKATAEVYQEVREALDYHPDLFVIYAGHNEWLAHNPAVRSFALLQDKRVWWIRDYLLHNSYLYRRLRTAYRTYVVPTRQLEENKTNVNLAEQRNLVAGFYVDLLHACADIAESAHIPLLYAPPIGNNYDWAPYNWGNYDPQLVSRIRAIKTPADIEAVRLDAEKAAATNPATAFYFGRALYDCGDRSHGFELLLHAADLDDGILRIPPSARRFALEQMSTLSQGRRFLAVLDVWPAIAAKYQTFGFNIFLDGMHPTVELHFELAKLMMQELTRRGWVPNATRYDPPPLSWDAYTPPCFNIAALGEVAGYLDGLMGPQRYYRQSYHLFATAMRRMTNRDWCPEFNLRIALNQFLLAEFGIPEPHEPLGTMCSPFEIPAEYAKTRVPDFRRESFENDESLERFKEWLRQHDYRVTPPVPADQTSPGGTP